MNCIVPNGAGKVAQNREETDVMSVFARRLAFSGLAACLLLLPGAARASDVIISNWGTNMFGVPYAVALEKGWFKEAGAPVTGAVGGGGGGSVIRNMLANDLPYGEIASSAAMDAQREGLPIVIVAGTARSFDNAWFVMPNSPLKGVKDLAGKRVAYTSPQSISQAFALMIIKRAGIDLASVTMIPAGGYAQGLTLMESGGADVAPAAEPLKTIKAGKYREIFNAEDSLPSILSVVAVTTRDYAAKHPDTIRAILTARRRAVEYVYAHPEEAGQITAKAYDMDEKIAVGSVVAATKTRQPVWSTGELDIKELTVLQQGLLLTGAPVADIDWKKLIDLSMLPPDLQAKSHLDAK
jgi:NitT/TauT family transport system substrate-binding protein